MTIFFVIYVKFAVNMLHQNMKKINLTNLIIVPHASLKEKYYLENHHDFSLNSIKAKTFVYVLHCSMTVSSRWELLPLSQIQWLLLLDT